MVVGGNLVDVVEGAVVTGSTDVVGASEDDSLAAVQAVHNNRTARYARRITTSAQSDSTTDVNPNVVWRYAACG